MTIGVLIAFYSTYGHVYKMAQSVEQGAKTVDDTETRMRRIPELAETKKTLKGQKDYEKAQKDQSKIPEITFDDLRWADGICWGTPTRYGNMSSQMKQFMDSTGELWSEGALEDKPAGIFTSTATIHGGQESTLITSMIPLLHLGMVIVGTPYGQNPQIRTTEGIGGTPYGPSTLAGIDGSRQPVEEELKTARQLGSRVAKVSKALKKIRTS